MACVQPCAEMPVEDAHQVVAWYVEIVMVLALAHAIQLAEELV